MNDLQTRQVTLITVGVGNHSTLLSKDDFSAMVGAVNLQLERDFAPAWGINWALAEVDDDAALAKYPNQIVVTDNVPGVGALGFHNLEANGEATAIVGVKPVLDSGGVPLLDPANPQRASVASVLSHEAIEMAADPYCNSFAIGPERNEGALYSYEACDPVEDQQYTVELRGSKVAVSNFVLPAFFNPSAPAGTRVDFLGLCPGPFQLTSGGYMSIMGPDGSYHQIYGDTRRPWKESGQATSLRSRRRAAHVAAMAKR